MLKELLQFFRDEEGFTDLLYSIFKCKNETWNLNLSVKVFIVESVMKKWLSILLYPRFK